MLRRNKHSNPLICRIDMTAFLSIELFLLSLFFVAATMRPDLPIHAATLAYASHPIPMPGALREDAIAVMVERNGRVIFGPDPISPVRLPERIRAAVHRGSERKVYLSVDRYAKYGAVREVLAAIRASGVEDVAFLVTERR